MSRKHEHQVTAHLDYREKDGYEKRSVTFYPKESSREPFQLDVYIGSEFNPFYLGPASIDSIAAQIYGAVGPSGRNTDYLFNLADTMRHIAPHVHDEHLFAVEKAVKNLCNKNDLVHI